MSTNTTSERSKHPRPTVVTLACVFIAVTAFLTLSEIIVALMDWATVDMQASLRPILRQLAAAGAVVSMAEVLRYLRWFFLAMVPFSVAAMVFAIYALRGDRTARVITTILAVAAGFVSLPIGVFGVIQATMLFLAAGALWRSDARRWYRGEPAAAVPVPAVDAQPVPAVDARPSPAEVAAPAPLPAAPSPVTRPTSVMTAGLLTVLGSLGAAGFAGTFLAVYAFARAAYVEAVKTGPFSDLLTERELELAMQISFWASVVILPLALAGVLGGIALLARRRIGRTATLWWAWTTAALGLVMLPIGLLATAGAGAVIVLLLRDDARQWTASR
ncbi:MAG TPA: hypothetical protein VJ782_04855 [Aeromicrobium sp.]|nr:hypothetical protein [Aeromicrobium sp.]